MAAYQQASKIVKPKLEALQLAQERLSVAEERLAEAEAKLKRCKEV